MAFHKNKALDNALKLLNQGKVPQAIAEYQQILRHDPKDQATLMTVGDLFVRQGDMSQATEYFERLAQVYLHNGFNSKAIAVYKKIAKIAPDELEPLECLAELYIQQGVLSEARPLFLQIAEAHLKANRAPKAVEVLRNLLDVEPENLRVQMRLAELYIAMGQKKEAAQTYLSYAQRLLDHNEASEAQKLIDQALVIDPASAPAIFLKAKALGAGNRFTEAVSTLEKHPAADAGGEVTNLLADLELRGKQTKKAIERGRRQLARGHAHWELLYHVAESLMEGGQAEQAFPLFRELRDPMIEAGEQDKFLKSLSNASERMPDRMEPLEALADFCRTTSDPFRLNETLSQLADAYAAAKNYDRAEKLLEELVDRNKNDERLVDRLNQLRARQGGTAKPVAPAKIETVAPPTAAPIMEEPLDEETQRYVSQALTDADLFSSYGLTQKATQLLENVLERAPRHTPALERLLDFHLGAGNERRTAELAAQLEQIHRERNDNVNAERFAELRQRFQKVAGLTTEELPLAPPLVPAGVPTAHSPSKAALFEPGPFEIVAEPPKPAAASEFELPMIAIQPDPAAAREVSIPVVNVNGQEADLSNEWKAVSQETTKPAAEEAPPDSEDEFILTDIDQETTKNTLEEIFEVVSEKTAPKTAADTSDERVFEIVDDSPAESSPAETADASAGEFELELMPEPISSQASAHTAEDFLKQLSEEVEEFDASAPAAAPVPEVSAHGPSQEVAPAAMASEPSAENLNQLAEVFQEFRNELGELGEENEDLETHYSLGIAYREMGLLDEAIGEFQKVATAVQKGKPFRYTMNCSTMLGLSFMDKGEPKIASLWYQRALEVPGLDEETVLALRYDLGVALETAGESTAALNNFRQVYAMNIDYRDVADRIATLQKHG